LKYVNQFLNSPAWQHPLWQVTGVVAAILAVIATYHTFNQSQEIKQVEVVKLADTSLIEIEEEVVQDISISYKDHPISNLSLFQVKLENSGNQAIVKDDYEQPIKFMFPPESEILEASILDRRPYNIGVGIQVEQNVATLTPALLNPGDRFIIRLLVANVLPRCIEPLPIPMVTATRPPTSTPVVKATPSPEATPTPCIDEDPLKIDARIVEVGSIEAIDAIAEETSITRNINLRFVFLFGLALFILFSWVLKRNSPLNAGRVVGLTIMIVIAGLFCSGVTTIILEIYDWLFG